MPMPVPGPVEEPAPAADPAPVPAGMDIEFACAGMDPRAPEPVRVRVEDAILVCPDGHRDRCEGETRFHFANCSGGPVRLRSVELIDPGGRARATYGFDHREIAARAVWTWKRRAYPEPSQQMVVDIVDSHGVPIEVAEQPVRTSNPTRDAAMAACVACDGVWGIPGVIHREACNCRATDAGKECRDADECEGACKFDHWAISRPAQRGGCIGTGERAVCSARAPAIGHPVGRCSERVVLRSCHDLLRRGITSEPDQSIPWGTSRMCID